MDSEFALQIGSLFPWRAQQTQILHSLLQCPPLPPSPFLTPYIYIFNIIKNKLLRIQKKCIVYLKNISFSLYTFPFFFIFPANRVVSHRLIWDDGKVSAYLLFTPSYRAIDRK